ncbi:MAG: hypothetical protein V1753_04815 [Pseudomonadota bacterium]
MPSFSAICSPLFTEILMDGCDTPSIMAISVAVNPSHRPLISHHPCKNPLPLSKPPTLLIIPPPTS